jgi:hypothetical protein
VRDENTPEYVSFAMALVTWIPLRRRLDMLVHVSRADFLMLTEINVFSSTQEGHRVASDQFPYISFEAAIRENKVAVLSCHRLLSYRSAQSVYLSSSAGYVHAF